MNNIKMWTEGVEVEDKALEQINNIAKMPFLFFQCLLYFLDFGQLERQRKVKRPLVHFLL